MITALDWVSHREAFSKGWKPGSGRHGHELGTYLLRGTHLQAIANDSFSQVRRCVWSSRHPPMHQEQVHQGERLSFTGSSTRPPGVKIPQKRTGSWRTDSCASRSKKLGARSMQQNLPLNDAASTSNGGCCRCGK